MSGPEEVLPPATDRWFEDYQAGTTYDLGVVTPSEDEIVSFALHYDPQPMHIERSRPGGVIASGWHTACLAMRQIAEHYLSSVGGLPSPGVEAIEWTAPVYPGESIHFEAELLETRVSASQPDRGILTTRFIARNPRGDQVMAFRAVNFILLRPERGCPS